MGHLEEVAMALADMLKQMEQNPPPPEQSQSDSDEEKEDEGDQQQQQQQQGGQGEQEKQQQNQDGQNQQNNHEEQQKQDEQSKKDEQQQQQPLSQDPTQQPPQGQQKAAAGEALPIPVYGVQALFEAFLVIWVVGTWVVFTYVGEKMAWHVVYFATSLSFLGGLWFGRLYDGIAWPTVRKSGGFWLMLMMPLFILALPALGKPFNRFTTLRCSLLTEIFCLMTTSKT